jgi:hypothetical protein
LYAQRADDCFVLLNKAKRAPKQTYTQKKDVSTWAREEKRKSLDKKVTLMLKHDYQSRNEAEDGSLSISTTITIVPLSLGKCPAASPKPYLIPAVKNRESSVSLTRTTRLAVLVVSLEKAMT